MEGHALSRVSVSREENTGLLGRSISPTSDPERDSGILEMGRQQLPIETARHTRWRALAARLLWFCVPSFLQGRHMREQICPAKLSPTAYLDGMRGLAALFVYFCHSSSQAFIMNKSWGYQGTLYGFFRLPIVRVFYCGPAAVSIFFIISGYALSYKPIRLIRSRKTHDFSVTLSSMTFRRAIRLFLPTTISTFIMICLIWIGAFESTREITKNRHYFKYVVEHIPSRPDSLFKLLGDWGQHIFYAFKLFDFMDRGALTNYDVHLWTIPVEYRCSIYLFVILFGTARLQTKYRFLTLLFVMTRTYQNSRWDLLMFIFGMMFAEWDHIRGAHTTNMTLSFEKQAKSSQERLKPIIWNLISIMGLYFLTQPDTGGEETPGCVYLTSLIPEWWATSRYRYWQCIGSVIYVFSVGYSAFWQRFFNTAPIQYLGKISYSLYLVHGPVMRTLGYHLHTLAWDITGTEGLWYNAGFVLGVCLSLPFIIAFADIFWRAIDIPTVKFARWLETRVNVKED
ncbi:acyltransferase family-domain-containing protein [Dactylonectria estremocensis]|uniref:Acyltransferase family-domain-containing protein n=1 Tax=Dactylonectria estremocensis TaxID=1079267 RepID=A0A9P9E8A9_9HYPO|nr:acyltransferase family-domain-containing protein [Dactylonectria estremocensis]